MTNKKPSRIRGILRGAAVYALIVALTLGVLDLLLIGLGLFPPQYETGDPELGWATRAPETGNQDTCFDMVADKRVDYFRNELGIRTNKSAAELHALESGLVIAAVGDSHSDQCMANAATHQGVLETRLQESGFDVVVLSNGVGRYSPLQAYLLFKSRLAQFGPDVLVLNLYTGNDFIDILRIDDRPHLVADGDSYRIAAPVWMRYADPDTAYRSRVAFIARKLGDSIGVRDRWIRLKLLSRTAGSDAGGLADKFRYIGDVRKSVEPSVGYSGALAAQFLNQQLYFHHFPDAPDEAIRRIDRLMQMIREELPDTLLVMSPIPSYQLATPTGNISEPLRKTMQRLPISNERSREVENRLYASLRGMADSHGWIFVDNLEGLSTYAGTDILYNRFDYHVTEAASDIIGELEAIAIAGRLGRQAPDTSDQP